MWVYNNDFKKWGSSTDSLLVSDFDYLKQQFSATRFYSKYLSGSTYIPISDVNNIYDILGKWQPRNWYLSTLDAPYSVSLSPNKFARSIDNSSSYEYYTKFISEYGLTLKNLFTPNRLIHDSLDNYTKVDIASTAAIDLTLTYIPLVIDGIKLYSGNIVLLKDQVTSIALDSSIDPDVYFRGNYRITKNLGTVIEYEYYNSENGLYIYDGKSLIRQNTLDDYEKCIRFSVYVANGVDNVGKQFFLNRLRDGYFPTTSKLEPIEFSLGKNWMLRNRVDYHNIFNANYNDIIKHGSSEYVINGLSYSIPERTISVGDFGIIINTQGGISNIIPNKYKYTLRGIAQTSSDYWICGDDSTLLRVRKHNFEIENIEIENLTNLKSISFFDDLRGVVVGDINTILLTIDGGKNWKRLKIDDFSSFNYRKVIFTEFNRFYIGGKGGVFIEIEENINGWTAYRRRISNQIDQDDEYLLVDNINDLYKVSVNWNSVNNSELLFIVTDNGNIVVHDINNVAGFDFLYLDFGKKYGDILNITSKAGSNIFYFTNNDGLYSFDLGNFTSIGVGNTYSNTILGGFAKLESNLYANEIFDYNGNELLLSGNSSLLSSATYSSPMHFSLLDPNFESRLKSKMLFLDYDMASKLNFFNDQGDYILPNSVKFDTEKFISQSSITSTSSGTFPKYIFDNISINDTIQIPSTIGMYSGFKVTVDISHFYLGDIAINLIKKVSGGDKIINLKNFGEGGSNNDLHFVSFSTNDNDPSLGSSTWPYNNGTYKMSKTRDVNTGDIKSGDIISNVISYEDFIQNGDIGGTWTISIIDRTGQDIGTFYTWSITFDVGSSYVDLQPIIHGATAPSNIISVENNWWTYKTDSEKTFEYLTSGQNDSNVILMGSTFSYYSNYSNNYPYELNIANVVTDFNELLKLAPSISLGGTTASTRYNYSSGNTQINLVNNYPKVVTSNTIYLYDYLMVIEVDLQWVVEKGNVIRFESDLVDGNFIVNRIETVLDRKFIYVYSEFNESIINGLSSSSIKIWNLNKYNSTEKLVENFNKHPMGIGYSMVQNGTEIEVTPLFNNMTSYYNLGSVMSVNGVYNTMGYDTSFLKFGYTPRYNLLDYLESINKNNNIPTFYATKEYLAMPIYENIPLGALSLSTAYIDTAGLTHSKNTEGNKNQNFIVLGSDFKLEWESIFIHTFVDVVVVQPDSNVKLSEKLLVLNKYQVKNYDNSGFDAYIIEFNKKINYDMSTLNGGTIQIRSRRTLKEISDDLQELNNIQKPKSKISTTKNGTYLNYETELSSKIPTDSYAKILLSDVTTVSEISALMYIDNKNELALNLTKVDKSFEIPILNTSDYNNKLRINCSDKHGLLDKDGVVLEFNGGINSSEYLNRQYFGYHNVSLINDYDFYVDVAYGNPVYVGIDKGVVKYLRKDPFLNYEPVDLVEVGLDKKANTAILLNPNNTILNGSTFSLHNVDYNRYRYRLIDSLTIDTLSLTYPWILEAEIKDAVIGLDQNGLVWYKGIWESGRWFSGTWTSGTWKYGDWYGGIWNSKSIKDNKTSIVISDKSSNTTNSTWITGRWYGGTWNNGTWNNGRWYDGSFNDGIWCNGTWNNGTWNNGKFTGGVWVDGTWNKGIFNTDNEGAFWLNGIWNGGDFENGVWYNGIFGADSMLSRFGTNSFNTRPSIWYGGKWKSGSFHSRLNEVNGLLDVSEVHKYSIWYSGKWMSGDFYGGVAYNMDFATGTWHGGILEDIEVIGINSENNSFILNGHFKFNIGDEIYIIDNNSSNEYSKYGSNSNPTKYVILKIVEDINYKMTEIYVDVRIDTNGLSSYKKSSGLLSLPIANTISEIISTQSVYYDVNTTSEIRVKLNLTNNNIGDLIINLKAPNGNVVNVKDYGLGGTMSVKPVIASDPWDVNPNSSMVDTIFTTTYSTNNFGTASSPYTYVYEMSKTIKVGPSASSFESSFTGIDISNLLNVDGGVYGTWSLYVKDMHSDVVINDNSSKYSINGSKTSVLINGKGYYTDRIRIGDNVVISQNSSSSPTFSNIETTVTNMQVNGYGLYLEMGATSSSNVVDNSCDLVFSSNPNKNNVLLDWELEFVNNHEVGAQIGYKIEDGFDMGLRVVSKFKNVNWKSGIWTNGIYDNGIFEGGIWYNGIFNGDWG